MKDKKNLFLLVFSLGLILSNTATASFVVKEKLTKDYKVDNKIGTEPVAYIIGRDEKYTSVEKALEMAQEGDIVTLVPPRLANYHPTHNPTKVDKVTYEIKKDCEIKKGVSLILPTDSITLSSVVDQNSLNTYIDSMRKDDRKRGEYFEKKDPETEELVEDTAHNKPSYTQYAENNSDKYLRTSLVIKEGVTLKNNGTLIVSGYLGAGGSAGAGIRGQTSHSYSQIVLEKNAKIVQNDANAATHCYGFIQEKEKNNNSLVNIISGKFYLPIIINDYKGFSFTSGIQEAVNNELCSPFNQFELRNIKTNINFLYNSSVIGVNNIYINQDAGFTSVDEVIYNEINLIGNTSSFLLQMTDSLFSSVNLYFDNDAQIVNITLIGGEKINNLNLNIKGLIDINTKDTFFPFSYRINLLLEKAVGQPGIAIFDSSAQRLKLLPGCKMKVGNSCKLTGKELIIYSAFIDGANGQRDDTRWSGGFAYPIKSGAEFTLEDNATIEMEGIGGTIFSNYPANISCTSTSTVTAREPRNQKQQGIQYVTKDYVNIIEKLNIVPTINLNKKRIYISQNVFYDPENYPNPFTPELIVNVNSTEYKIAGHQDVIFYDENATVSLTFLKNIAIAKYGKENSNGSYNLSTYDYEEEINTEGNIILSVINSNLEITNDNSANEFLPINMEIRSLTPKLDGKDPLFVGKSIYLELNIDNYNQVYDKNITWSSSDETIAVVDQNGQVTGKSLGKVTIYAENSGIIASYETEVLEDATVVGIESAVILTEDLNYSSDKVEGEIINDPEDINYKEIQYVSNNPCPTAQPGNFKYNIEEKRDEGQTKFILNYSPDNALITNVERTYYACHGTSGKSYMVDYNGTRISDRTPLTDNGSLSTTIVWEGHTNATPDSDVLHAKISDITGKITDVYFVILHDSGIEIPSCLTANTKILMSDGSIKPAKELKKDDKIFAYNHFSGTFEPQRLLANIIVDEKEQKVISLTFSENQKMTVLSGHGLFNLNRNTYEIYYGEQFFEHIGEEFVSVDFTDKKPSLRKTKLLNVEIKIEKIMKFSPVTEYNINCIADGMLNIPDDVEGLFEAFHFTDLNHGLLINQESFYFNVLKYGIYEYNDVSKVIPKYLFDKLNFKYFKTFIGMGVLTYEKVNHWIETYAKEMMNYNELNWNREDKEPLSDKN